jgi:D-lyxose ketol-isomerase
MKRSTINSLISEAKEFFSQAGFNLPPFAFWDPDDWAKKGSEVNEIRENALGWDITDFGSGNFAACGLLLFTLRNGNYRNPASYPKMYSEKIMIVKEGQVTPMHFHRKKREDIINRAGGNLILELYKSTQNEQLSEESFFVSVDGVQKKCLPKEHIILTPGESICLEPYIYHTFYGTEGTTIVGEVSDVNDDVNDNRFLQPIGRFPKIEEDEKPIHLLCTEYPAAQSHDSRGLLNSTK